jgi:hypothetical protein
MNTEFIPASLNAVELYSEFKSQLATLKAESNALVFDYASAKGNKEARSHIYSLRKINAALEKARKEAKAEALEYGRKVDSMAKEIAGELDALIEQHDKPLREIEERETARIDAIKRRMQTLDFAPLLTPNTTAEQLQSILAGIEAFALDASLGEFMATAALAKDKAIGELKSKLAERQQYEAEQAELARLRAEAVERERLDREARIAQEAADKAKREAEQAAQRESMRVEQERIEAERKAADAIKAQELALERAKRETAEANERAAKAEQEAKAKAERELAAKQATERAEAEKREANKKHQAKVNNEAVAGLVVAGLSEDAAKAAIVAIAQRKVPNVTISY